MFEAWSDDVEGDDLFWDEFNVVMHEYGGPNWTGTDEIYGGEADLPGGGSSMASAAQPYGNCITGPYSLDDGRILVTPWEQGGPGAPETYIYWQSSSYIYCFG
jgi:hypothetical protein